MIENEIIKAIKDSDGKLFSIEYQKKDGTTTQMTCRTGVVSALKGGPPKTNPDLITVFSFDRNNYRTLFKDKIKSFKCGDIVLSKDIE